MGIRPILNLLHKIEVRRNCSLPRLRVSLFMFFLRSYEIKVSQTFFLVIFGAHVRFRRTSGDANELVVSQSSN